MDVYAAFFEVGILHELGVEGDGGFDWADLELVEGAECSGDRGFSGFGVNDEFADHGIVVWWDAVSGADMRVHADSETSGCFVCLDESR